MYTHTLHLMKTKLSQDVKSRDRSPVFHSLEDPKRGGTAGEVQKAGTELATAAVGVVSGCPKSDEVSGEERKRGKNSGEQSGVEFLAYRTRSCLIYVYTDMYILQGIPWTNAQLYKVLERRI